GRGGGGATAAGRRPGVRAGRGGPGACGHRGQGNGRQDAADRAAVGARRLRSRSGTLAELGGGPAGGAAVAGLQGAERLTEDHGHALTRQVVQFVWVGRGVVVLLRPARVPHVERGGGPNGLVGG